MQANPNDARLVEQIRQITQGGARLLVTLARRGKGLERNEPLRAASLLRAVATHPLYKGGRLAFDMLEIEDLMLDGSPVDPMSTREVIQVLGAGVDRLAERLRAMGAPAQGRGPVEADRRDNDAPGGSVRDRAQSARAHAVATPLPLISLGPVDDAAVNANASGASDDGRDTSDIGPPLRSSDYLFDYVVLGLLDVVAVAPTLA
jgi:hypothetical protein